MDIISLVVSIVLMIFVIALAWAVWWKLVDKALDYLEELLGKNITGWISIISVFVIAVAVFIDLIKQ